MRHVCALHSKEEVSVKPMVVKQSYWSGRFCCVINRCCLTLYKSDNVGIFRNLTIFAVV